MRGGEYSLSYIIVRTIKNMTKLDLLEANKIYDSIIQTNKDLGKNLLDAETYSFAKKFIEERDISEEIKKYTMFLINEKAYEEVQRITAQ